MALGGCLSPRGNAVGKQTLQSLFLWSPATDTSNLWGAEVEWEASPRLAFKRRYLPLNLGANTAGTNPQTED